MTKRLAMIGVHLVATGVSVRRSGTRSVREADRWFHASRTC